MINELNHNLQIIYWVLIFYYAFIFNFFPIMLLRMLFIYKFYLQKSIGKTKEEYLSTVHKQIIEFYYF